MRLSKWIGLGATLVLGIGLVGCGGISDCREDGEKCAAMIAGNGEKCALAFRLKQGEAQRKHCEGALKAVAKAKSKTAIPGLLEMLEAPETGTPYDAHRAEAAKVLARIGDKQAVPALLEAIDIAAGSSSDPRDKNTNGSNEAIAEALGELGDTSACSRLVDLMHKSRHDYTVLKSIRAIGQIGCKDAVEDVAKLALTHDNKFMRKNAVDALGDIGDISGADALIQMMFVEYQGVSFYREASFALFKIGPQVADKLLATMEGKNEDVKQYFQQKGGLMNTATKAKCGFVLGDLRDDRAIDPLIEAFKTASQPDNQDPVLLIYSAAPLGLLKAKKAVPVLAKEMLDLDGSKREPIMRSLNQIGDRSVVNDMITKGMSQAFFVESCVKQGLAEKDECAGDLGSLTTAVKPAADHASNLGGAEHYDAYKAAMEAMPVQVVKDYLAERLKRLDAAKECKSDAACWAKKAEDADPIVREKAAWELGRVEAPDVTVPALKKLIGDDDLFVRSAAIFSAWGPLGKDAVPEIEKRLEDEAGSSKFVRVNEDLRRLLVHLKR